MGPALDRPPRRRGAVEAPAVKLTARTLKMERLAGGDHAPQDRVWGQNL